MAFDEVINLRWLLIGGFPDAVLGGLALNLSLASVAFVISFAAGHLLAWGRLSAHRPLRALCTAYIELMRAVPLLIVLFWFYFALPLCLHTTVSPIVSAVWALSAYAAAYQAEFIRAGIRAVGAGQIDAARSLGLSRGCTLVRIVMAQAHRTMLPTYASYFTSLFKDSSALYILGLVELMQAGLIVAERHPAKMLEVYLTLGSLFFIVCGSASWLGRQLERRLAPRVRALSPRRSSENPHAHA